MSFSLFVRKSFLLGLLVVVAVSSCKKSSDGPSKNGTRDELTRDSIYLYAKETYLWNDALPSYNSFSPRQYSSFDDEVAAIKSYKLNSAGKPLDKYSFIDQGEVSDEIGEGISGDYGFFIGFNGVAGGYDPLDIRVNYVYQGSPAGLAGLERGDQIVQMNGRSNLDGRKSADIDFLNDVFFGSVSTVTLQVRKKDNSVQNVTVSKSIYNINPILAAKVFTAGTKKIGYFALNSFLQITASDGKSATAFKAQLDAVLNAFQSQGVTELIVDLRYNGGGSVETANYLANWLVPAGKNGTTMHTDYFNQTMQDRKATILKNQKFWYEGTEYSYYDVYYTPDKNTEKFAKQGSLALSGVYFLVTGSTASASELVINSLTPVTDVKLIGETTYGKPVGFFAIHIDQYDLYIPQFQTKNQTGYGDYFDGLSVTQSAYDDISKEFGDPSERYLAYALAYAANGNFTVSSARTSATAGTGNVMSAETWKEVSTKLGKDKFKGMIEGPKKP